MEDIRRVGIVGHGRDKFGIKTRCWAKERILDIMDMFPGAVFVSGHSPVGGVDIWVEEIGEERGVALDIKTPEQQSWEGEYGFKARNIDIAKSDVVFVILADKYPVGYKGRRFNGCFHCAKNGGVQNHVKSGGCWTGWKAIELGNRACWMVYGVDDAPIGDATYFSKLETKDSEKGRRIG